MSGHMLKGTLWCGCPSLGWTPGDGSDAGVEFGTGPGGGGGGGGGGRLLLADASAAAAAEMLAA